MDEFHVRDTKSNSFEVFSDKYNIEFDCSTRVVAEKLCVFLNENSDHIISIDKIEEDWDSWIE